MSLFKWVFVGNVINHYLAKRLKRRLMYLFYIWHYSLGKEQNLPTGISKDHLRICYMTLKSCLSSQQEANLKKLSPKFSKSVNSWGPLAYNTLSLSMVKNQKNCYFGLYIYFIFPVCKTSFSSTVLYNTGHHISNVDSDLSLNSCHCCCGRYKNRPNGFPEVSQKSLRNVSGARACSLSFPTICHGGAVTWATVFDETPFINSSMFWTKVSVLRTARGWPPRWQVT